MRRLVFLCLLVFSVFICAAEPVEDNVVVSLDCQDCPDSFYKGQEVTLRVLLSTDVDLQGWSFGIRWNPEELSLVSNSVGSAVQTIIDDPASTEFINRKPVDGGEGPVNGPGVVQAVVVDMMQAVNLAPGQGYEVEVLTFKILTEPAIGDPPMALPVVFTDDLGDPAVATIYVKGGQSIPPVMENADVMVASGGDCMIQNFACTTDPDNAYLSWEFFGCDGERPFDVLLLYRDGDMIAEVGALGPGDTTFEDLGLEPGIYTYTLAWVYWPLSGDPITLDYVTCEAEVIALVVEDAAPAEAFLSGKVRNGLGELVPGELVLTGRGFTALEDTQVFIGDKPVEVTEVIGDSEIRGTIPCMSVPGVYDIRLVNSRGEYTLPDAFMYGWMRGDVNIDGGIDIQDCIDLLNFLFKIEGWQPLICMDAADVNDSGFLDISDPIFLSYALFSGNTVLYKIPEPYDAPLMEDPTDDDLDCSLDDFDCEGTIEP